MQAELIVLIVGQLFQLLRGEEGAPVPTSTSLKPLVLCPTPP